MARQILRRQAQGKPGREQEVFVDSTDDDDAAKESIEDENKDEAGNLDHVDDGEKLLHR